MSYESGANQKQKQGGKKHGDAPKRKLIDFTGQQTPLFLFRREVRRKRGFIAAERTEERKTRIFQHPIWFGAISPFVSCFLVFEFFSRWTHVEEGNVRGTFDLNQRQHFPA